MFSGIKISPFLFSFSPNFVSIAETYETPERSRQRFTKCPNTSSQNTTTMNIFQRSSCGQCCVKFFVFLPLMHCRTRTAELNWREKIT